MVDMENFMSQKDKKYININHLQLIGKAIEVNTQPLSVPLYLSRISAGFPSPADDYVETALDLNKFLIKNPPATFMVKVSGDSMTNAGIDHGDILIVDRSQKAVHGKIVVAVFDGELTVKRLFLKDNKCQLIAENPSYKPISISEEQELQVWGVVTGVVRRL